MKTKLFSASGLDVIWSYTVWLSNNAVTGSTTNFMDCREQQLSSNDQPVIGFV